MYMLGCMNNDASVSSLSTFSLSLSPSLPPSPSLSLTWCCCCCCCKVVVDVGGVVVAFLDVSALKDIFQLQANSGYRHADLVSALFSVFNEWALLTWMWICINALRLSLTDDKSGELTSSLSERVNPPGLKCKHSIKIQNYMVVYSVNK